METINGFALGQGGSRGCLGCCLRPNYQNGDVPRFREIATPLNDHYCLDKLCYALVTPFRVSPLRVIRRDQGTLHRSAHICMIYINTRLPVVRASVVTSRVGDYNDTLRQHQQFGQVC